MVGGVAVLFNIFCPGCMWVVHPVTGSQPRFSLLCTVGVAVLSEAAFSAATDFVAAKWRSP